VSRRIKKIAKPHLTGVAAEKMDRALLMRHEKYLQNCIEQPVLT
jgi:hypothetical protein